MKKSFVLGTLFAFVFASCHDNNSKSKPAPNTAENIIEQDSVQYCQAAEDHLVELGCIAKSKPYTVKGKYFHEFCEETIKNGINLSPKCISEVKSCNEVNACFQNKK